MNFVVGGLSGMSATSIIQPVDTLKVRIQIAGEAGTSTSPMKIAKQMHAEGGVKGFYKGIDSALMRQAVYGTARLGLYFTFTDMYKNSHNGEFPTYAKIAASFTAGALGSAIGNPFDLALVRFQSDATLPKAEQRNYKHVFDAIYRISKEEGVISLWKGVGPTMGRAVSLNVAMLVSYDEAREKMESIWGPCKKAHFSATLVSSVFTAIFSLPFDNMKTKIQKQKVDSKTGKLPYASLVDCFKKTVAKEGPTGLWTGLPTYYFRVGPHAICVLAFADFYKRKFGMIK